MRNTKDKIKKIMTATFAAIYIGAALPSLQSCVILPPKGSSSSEQGDSSTSESGTPFEGDWAKELIANNYTPNVMTINMYQRGALTASYKNFGKDTVSAPEEAPYTSFVEYTLTGNNSVPSHQTYSANFINFSSYMDTVNTLEPCPMPAGLYEKYKDIDWTDAYISFWIYNDTDIKAELHGTDTDFDDPNTSEIETEPTNKSGKTTEGKGKKFGNVAAKTWKKIKLSLKTYCDIKSDVIATGVYNIKLWLTFEDESVTEANYAQAKWSFYITGFEFISGSDSK